MRFNSNRSIKLTAIFGICISIWSHAKEERFGPLAGFRLLGNRREHENTGISRDANRLAAVGKILLLIIAIGWVSNPLKLASNIPSKPFDNNKSE